MTENGLKHNDVSSNELQLSDEDLVNKKRFKDYIWFFSGQQLIPSL